MIAALHGALIAYRAQPQLRGVLLDAEGPHFSFGASVEEHLPASCAAMLASLHALILAMVEFPVPILVAVRGQCLGGGLEVALAGGPIFAAPRRAVRPARDQARRVRARPRRCCCPTASTRAAAEDLLFSGRSISGAEALCDAAWCTRCPTTPRPRRWPTSSSTWPARAPPRWPARWPRRAAPMLRDVRHRLAEVERLYLDRLMKTRDANEGLAAFLAKRTPQLGAPLMEHDRRSHRSSPIVERCQALFEDLDFNAVKEWKAAVPGRKAIGYMPVYVPRELIHAAGMLPVGILGGGDALEVIQGDAYYQSYICRIPRSTIELGLTGRLDCLDGMLFPSICDVIRNLSGMWQILFKDKYVTLHRRAAELRRRDRRQVLHRGDADRCARTWASCAARRSPTPS